MSGISKGDLSDALLRCVIFCRLDMLRAKTAMPFVRPSALHVGGRRTPPVVHFMYFSGSLLSYGKSHLSFPIQNGAPFTVSG